MIGVGAVVGGRRLLDNINLLVGEGELLAVVGPSGAGKTTLLRVLTGLLAPTTGTIRLGDRDITGIPPFERGVAMVFQDDSLYSHLDVAGNIQFPLKVRHHPQELVNRRTEEAAGRVGVRRLLPWLPAALSAGERSMVATARALARQAAVLLLDEPLSRADSAVRTRMREELRRLHVELGVTMILCTNDQIQAMGLADRLAIIDEGRIRQIGPPMELYNHPVDTMVAGFLGSMNLFPASIEDEGVLAIGDDHLPYRCPVPGPLVLAGLRPEDLRLAEPHDSFHRCLHVVVGRAEYLGSHTMVHFGLRTPEITYAARLPGHWRGAAGNLLELAIDFDRLRLFDPASGRSLN
jgi:multiple sugar transport system ATP-binding protein